MRAPIETKRLVLREILLSDVDDLFELDSDPEVMKYIGIPPVKDMSETRKIIGMLRKQYEENGIGRWAVELKTTGEVIGWSGLKLHDEEIDGNKNFYELGYRFKPKHWGQGYATESSEAWLNYAFNKLFIKKVFAATDPRHKASRKVLEKLNFQFVKQLEYYDEIVDWFICKKP
jgi:RimJ/RimL family protein N-acetyltransferase